MGGYGGVYSAGILRDGVAPEGMMGGDELDGLMGSAIRFENKRIKELDAGVPTGYGYWTQNRLLYVTLLWPMTKWGIAVAFDRFVSASDTTQLPSGSEGPLAAGSFWRAEAVRRRRVLAAMRPPIAYVCRHQDAVPLTEEDVAAAVEWALAHGADRLDEVPVRNILETQRPTVYDEDISFTEDGGIGVRARSAGINASGADEAARLARISAPPTHDAEGKPLKET